MPKQKYISANIKYKLISIERRGEYLPQCIICMKPLANEVFPRLASYADPQLLTFPSMWECEHRSSAAMSPVCKTIETNSFVTT